MQFREVFLFKFFVFFLWIPSTAFSVKAPHSQRVTLSPVTASRPMAFLEPGGWVLGGQTLVGEYNSKWLVAYDIRNFTPIWFAPNHDGGLSATSLILGKNVLFSFRDGTVSKLDLNNGKELWQAPLDSFADRSIVQFGDRLLVVTAAKLIYSLDVESGQVQWVNSDAKSSKMYLASSSLPLVYNKDVYLGTSSGELLCIDIESGTTRWHGSSETVRKKFVDFVGDMIVINHALLYTRSDGVVGEYSLLARRSENLLPVGTIADISASLFRSGSYILGSSDGTILNFDTKTRKILWRLSVDQPVHRFFAGEKMLYVFSSRGVLFALDLATGGMLWHDNIAQIPGSDPIWPENQQDLFYVPAGGYLFGYRSLAASI